MNDEKISVIVPFYNTEKYLNECIESIANQTYDNIEILLIDDGSKDSSINICKLWEKKDKRIKLICKENGGQASARNLGINIATGKYIIFIDSDDFVSTDFVEFLYKNLIKYNADVSACGYCYYYDSGTRRMICKKKIKKLYNNIEAIKYLNVLGYYSVSPCNKIFKKDILEKNKFPEKVKYEDNRIMYKIFNDSNAIYYDSTVKYFYRQRKNSTVRDEKNMYQLIDAIEEEKNFFSNNNEIEKYINQNLVISYMSIYRYFDKNERKKLYKKMKEAKIKFTYKDLKISKQIQMYLFVHVIKIYNVILKII